MSSLPLISHHLYVAAVCQDGRAESGSRVEERPAVTTDAPATTVPVDRADELAALSAEETEPIRFALGTA